jgi:hypothetical protein
MRAIINGVRYDSDKAALLGETEHGFRSDFGWYRECLYKTPRSGRYFLSGEGGPRSHYAVSTRPGEWSGGERIVPLTEADALAWAERNLSASVVEKHFGHLIADA